MAAPGTSTPAPQIEASTPIQVLLASVRRAADPGRGSLCARPDLDWDKLFHLSVAHGLEAFLLREIRQQSLSAPPHVLERLERDSAQLAARNLALGRETLAVSSLLQRRGIPHLVYKGPGLGQHLYGTLALRPSRDIDFLVAPEQAAQTVAVLKDAGYTDPQRLGSAQLAAMIRYGAEYSLTKQGIEADIHWRPAPELLSRSLDLPGLWRRATTIKLFDAQLPTFAPEDLFVLLCLHAGEHGWAHLSLFADLVRLLAISRDFDWEIVRGHVRDENVRRAVDITLLILATQFDIPVPGPMLRREMQVELLASRVVSEFWLSPETAPHMETSLRWLLERCKGEPFAARLRWVWGSLMTPTLSDVQRFPMPARLQFLYPLLRFFRLILRINQKTEVLGTQP